MKHYVLLVTIVFVVLFGSNGRAQAPTSDAVVFPNEQVAFIIGPQLKSGSALNPRPSFDRIATERGLFWCQKAKETPPVTPDNDFFILLNYYDLVLVQYINYYRTNDVRFLTCARELADRWWDGPGFKGGQANYENGDGLSPRNASVTGMMLRAMDGHPEMWPTITNYVRYMFDMWLGRYVKNPPGGLVYGVRDSSYMLLFATQLAKVHPDPAVRAEWLVEAERAATEYFGRLQQADGSWRWDMPDQAWFPAPDEGIFRTTQVFQVGLLLQALGDLYAVTPNPTVKENLKNQILKGVTFIHTGGPFIDKVVLGHEVLGYEYLYGGGSALQPHAFDNGIGGTDDSSYKTTQDIAERRGLGQTVQHAYGLARMLSNDPKYIVWGDAVFKGGYGEPTDQDPGDGIHNNAAGDVKSYNESFRTTGRYLAYRVGTNAPNPAPVPTSTPACVPVKVVSLPATANASTWSATLLAAFRDGYKLVAIYGGKGVMTKDCH